MKCVMLEWRAIHQLHLVLANPPQFALDVPSAPVISVNHDADARRNIRQAQTPRNCHASIGRIR